MGRMKRSTGDGHSAAMRSFILVSVVVFSLGAQRALAEPRSSDSEAARALAARARAHLDTRQPEPAARLFDAAHAHAPHPLWLAAAGEAWLEALRPDLAVQRLEAALADGAMSSEARDHTRERLATAQKLAPLVAAARASGTKPEAALAAWREAFARSNLGRCLLEAARAAERARRFGDADTLFALAAERDDLAADERRGAREALMRLRERDAFTRRAPPTEPADTAGWVVVASGAAALAGGVMAWIVGEDQRARVRSAMNDDGALSSRMSRAEAQALERSANTWSTVGWVAAGVGVVALGVGVGVVMIEARPERRGAIVTARVVW
jgi:tetratricopeptide (TPR) repeat protein